MSDRLLRESDVIEAVAQYISCDYPTEEMARDDAELLIGQIPSADRWMPCSERLPKRQGHYICTCKDGSKYKRTTFVKWSNGWQLTGTRSYWIVLAWMPLPKPYKGEDDE